MPMSVPRCCVTSRMDAFLLTIGVIGVVVCSYLLFFYTPKLSLEGTSQIGYINPKGVIRRRIAKSLHWENLQERSVLFMRDIVYATKDATATIELNGGKTFELLSDSMIQMDEVSSDSINITLIEGQVKGKDVAAVSVKKEVKFRMPAYPTRGLSQLIASPVLDAFELRRSELLARIKDYMTVKKNRLVLKPMAALKQFSTMNQLKYFNIDLISPENIRYNLRANRWLEFEWTQIPLPDTKFVIELSRTSDFVSKISQATQSSRIKLQIEEEGTYFWRVRSERGTDVCHSKSGEFHMSLRSGMTQKINVRIPAVSVTGFTSEIAQDDKFKKIIRAEVVQAESCNQNRLPKGKYFCRIRSLTGTEVIKSYDFTIH